MIIQQTFPSNMTKKKVVIVTGDTEALIRDTLTTPTDWTKCVICQTEQGRCPVYSTRSGIHGYDTFAFNLFKFEKLGAIPLDVDPKCLGDGEGIHYTLENHRAWCHKICYNKF